MLDDVVGGYTPERQKLRQAISIALDFEEYIEIFENGRGEISHSPIPPGIFGFEPGEIGINRYAYDWGKLVQRARRKSLDEARRLLAEAGYANGQDRDGKPLVVYFDNYRVGAQAAAELNWYRKKLEAIGITLEVRTTDYNRFQEKVHKGNFQILSWGWNADYPDPENFLFLLYGPNSMAKTDGENVANYDNPDYNRLFDKMQNMENSPARLAIIREMKEILQSDAPWIFTYHPVSFGLYHEWLKNGKPNDMANNEMKYQRIDGKPRAQRRAAWNKPVLLPVMAVVGLLIIGTIPAAITVWKRERGSGLA